ncbi:tRNA lysidine(34) synthetase TilS [Albimonas sp. CAU 1670]|uniref:tRNA lysidine(34) synthetase TilS n=1 Tax=Albimonas sp. CAU 1670 TaxID=3032599 RepID=UPI0023DBB9FB|nr:tRNA lysidine(34) synthetase TilS [Albimonas sp. CAU 1670]MDF2233555.1 tRNA lysidine(34) synthetase TilS [Albimonas sp. CAU 1670]
MSGRADPGAGPDPGPAPLSSDETAAPAGSPGLRADADATALAASGLTVGAEATASRPGGSQPSPEALSTLAEPAAAAPPPRLPIDLVSPPPEPGDAEIAAQVRAALISRLDALAPPTLGLAVSGGGDSLALLLAAVELSARRPLRIEAVTVDHGLRAEAGVEAAWTAHLCARLGVPHATLRWTDRPESGNLAEAARDARAGLIAGWAAERGLEAVALAHTLDDQAETLLMRLARGSGLDGLSAMREVSHRAGARWLRPALDLRREDLRALLRHAGQGWIEDPSNEDPARDRVKARRALAALRPVGVTAEGIAATAGRLAEDSDALRDLAADFLRGRLEIGGAGELRLPRAALAEAPRALRRRVLAELFRALAGAAHAPRARALAEIEGALLSPDPLAPRTLGGCVILADAPGEGAEIVLHREPAALPAPTAPLGEAWDGRWRLEGSDPDVARAAERAVLGPLGATGLALLAAEERSGAWTPSPAWARAPRHARAAAPALRVGGRLAAAPLAGWGVDPGQGPGQGVAPLARATLRDLLSERILR